MYILYFEIILKVTNIITRGPLKDFDKFTCEGFFLKCVFRKFFKTIYYFKLQTISYTITVFFKA